MSFFEWCRRDGVFTMLAKEKFEIAYRATRLNVTSGYTRSDMAIWCELATSVMEKNYIHWSSLPMLWDFGTLPSPDPSGESFSVIPLLLEQTVMTTLSRFSFKIESGAVYTMHTDEIPSFSGQISHSWSP